MTFHEYSASLYLDCGDITVEELKKHVKITRLPTNTIPTLIPFTSTIDCYRYI